MSHFVISALSAVAYGGYSYFRNLLPALSAIDTSNRYTILVKPQHMEEMKVRANNFSFISIPAATSSVFKRTAWEQVVLPRELKKWGADAVYTANNVGLLHCRIPVVIAVRNLEPFFHRIYRDTWKARARNSALYWLTLCSVRRATRVIAVSEFTKKVVSKECSLTDGKIRIIYHGQPRIEPEEEAASWIKLKHGLDGEYFLTNSRFVPYSNLHTLIEGYGIALRSRSDLPKLALAGGDWSTIYKAKVLATIRKYGLDKKVVFLGLIPYSANLAMMKGAKLFLFATMLEACPNTLIEAMAMGCPIACSNLPPMPEIAGAGARYFDPGDPDDIARSILSMAVLPRDEIKALTAMAAEQVSMFNWEETARRLVSVLGEVSLQR